jgi:HK97 family phage prohead protease
MRDLFMSLPVARVKAITGADQPGTFEAIVSVFGNVDADGEIVSPGAFTKTLADGPKPIVYSHDWMSVPIGQTLEAREVPEGLYVKGRLFVADDEDHARAREVYAAMRAGALTEFSFGGRVVEETRRENEDGSVSWLLNEIDLVEYGPCLKGANPATRLVAIKSMIAAGIIDRDEARKTLGLDGDAAPAEPVAPVEAAPSETDVAPRAPAAAEPVPTADAPAPADAETPRSLLGLDADADEAALVAAIRAHATPTPSLPDGGGVPQHSAEDREAVAELLLLP